jgi:hypothetical protein
MPCHQTRKIFQNVSRQDVFGREAQILFNRVNLVFQLGIRGDVYPVELEYHSTGAEPLLQQQAFEQHQGRVGAGAFLPGADDVMAEQDGFDAGPIDGVAELVHSPC